MLAPSTAAAQQEEQQATQVDYDLTAETAVGTGSFTAYQLVTNRHHALATRPNTAYLRGALTLSHRIGDDLTLAGGVDGIAAVHADHRAYLQQCYANLSWREFFIEAGSREPKPTLRDEQLSAGMFVNGINAKPVPQVHVGTSDFWTVPYTRGWLQIHFDFGYGKFMDSGYREDKFREGGSANWMYAKGAYYHQKHLYLRSDASQRVFVTVGIEHAVQLAGSMFTLRDGQLVESRKPTGLKDFLKVILPEGDSNYFEHDAMEDWVYGNHIGMMTCQVGWNIDGQHQLQAYVDNPFEDGSGIRKGNGWDGLWGVGYSNKARGRQLLRGAVVEYFQSTNQSGPLHWDRNDYPEPLRSQITDFVTGKDNYYLHSFYGSYAHYGMTPGIALITSPIYNKDGYTNYRDNRVKAWHVGVSGELTEHVSYLLRGSYREGWGTYDVPLPTKHHSLDAMLQGTYSAGPWQVSAAYAIDKGNIYGDCSTFNLKINYHGKIL